MGGDSLPVDDALVPWQMESDVALASCGKHLTYTLGCPTCDAAERARRSQKKASRQARQVQRDVRAQNRLITEQTAVQEEGNRRLAEQSALQREQNQLLARQNAFLAQQATDEAAFRWGMWLQTPDGQKLEGWIKRRVMLADTMREAGGRWSDAWAPLIA